ncbi:dTDP-4-dehydrorhamnose reductase family protein [Nakamurella sp.]|uniref:dTDP-4-dehydrorhamnose reductase family protein n=1 Tax=Nakamurella sp. TaxID=1869182 RepID=UPI003B3A86A7
MILGALGMLGHALLSGLAARHEVVGTLRSPTVPAALAERLEPGVQVVTGVDALAERSIIDVFEQVRPDVVVNCIGLVKQQKLARQAIPAIEINALLPHRLALWCEQAGCRLIHISTDCVFAGTRGGYRESDPPDAIDLYGRTKALGELAGQSHCLTLRTSIIGRELDGRQGLLEWFLHQRGTIGGYRQAIFSGLPTVELCSILDRYVLPDPGLYGMHHVSAEPINKYDLLNLFRQAYQHDVGIVPLDEPRIDRSLNSDRFRQRTGFRPASWERMVAAMADPPPRDPARARAGAGTA